MSSPWTEAASRDRHDTAAAVLGLVRTARQDDVLRAWRRLVLLHHPDKRAASAGSSALGKNATQGGQVQRVKWEQGVDGEQGGEGERRGEEENRAVDIRAVNEAKWVLGDPQRRRAYDESLEQGILVAAPIPTHSGPRITTWLSLSDFTPHYSSQIDVESTASSDLPKQVAGETEADAERQSEAEAESQSEADAEAESQSKAGAEAEAEAEADSQSEAEATAEADGELESDAEPSYYTHPCRCSRAFTITRQDLEDGVEVVGCPGCGEWVGVGYEVVEGSD